MKTQDRLTISWRQFQRQCRYEFVGECSHFEQPEPFDNSYHGPSGKCTKARCPIWARWAKRDKDQSS